MPVSETTSFSEPFSGQAQILISPFSVNLAELLSKLRRDCLSLPLSVWRAGISGATSVTKRTRPSFSIGSTVEMATRTISSSLKVSAKTSILPASTLDRSSTPLMRLSRCSELTRTFCKLSFCKPAICPSVFLNTRRVKPMIAFSGVRSSWLILARNCDL